MKKVFIDGSAGTTGLRIHERLASREDIELLSIDEMQRKDPVARAEMLNAADIAFLCLPDAAAREAVTFVENPNTVIIDTSTAHRTDDDWCYGFAELPGARERIASAKRISNPGCHATGFIAVVAPLVEAGLLDKSAKLSSVSLTGYSGGGKKMIAEYESGQHDNSGSQYALGQSHKHLPEMMKYCSLENAPVFSPVVVPHYSGMQTTVMLHGDTLKHGNLEDVMECLRDAYSKEGLVKFVKDPSVCGFLSSTSMTGRDDLTVSAFGNDERIILVSAFDNLGKGASGAAIQNMNLALGCEQTRSLITA
ncbi:MAG: N-acetyl-gamma-glutamyl-phosphate reductase [Kiritimatiellae bacterium]|nr:N-acetyl-gamma-glutamyl-phosphate reductase [Kiritimatiellia bacterium]